MRDLGFHDYFAVVLADCVASDVRALHDASMLVMKAYRADVVDSAEVLAAWQGRDTRPSVLSKGGACGG